MKATKQTSTADPVTSIRLSDELREEIALASLLFDCNQSDAIRELVRRGLNSLRGRHLGIK